MLSTVALFASVVVASSTAPLTLRSLDRQMDPVVLTGDQLESVVGVQAQQLRLFASRGGRMEPIPYQIDERDAQGNWCWQEGEGVTQDEDEGRVDANDELVFLAGDAGDRVARAAWPEGNGGGFEIELTDPQNGTKAWAYLLAFRNPPEPSPVDYVRGVVDDNNNYAVEARDYHLDNDLFPPNAFRASNMFVRPEPFAKTGHNILDSTKIRIQLGYKFIKLTKDETQFQTKLVSQIDGPVRMIVKNDMKMYLFLGIWLPSPNSVAYMYPWGFSVPNLVELPVTLNDDGKSNFRVSMDAQPGLEGYQFYSDRNLSPVAVDGRMDEAERNLDTGFPRWIVITGDKGTRIVIIEIDPLLQREGNELYYLDDSTLSDEPEFQPGQMGNAGFRVNLSGLKKGKYTIKQTTFLLRDFKVGDHGRYLRISDAPLGVELKMPPS